MIPKLKMTPQGLSCILMREEDIVIVSWSLMWDEDAMKRR